MPTVNVDPVDNVNAGNGASAARAAGQPGGTTPMLAFTIIATLLSPAHVDAAPCCDDVGAAPTAPVAPFVPVAPDAPFPATSVTRRRSHGAGGARGIGGALPPQAANKAPDGIDGVAAPVLAM